MSLMIICLSFISFACFVYWGNPYRLPMRDSTRKSLALTHLYISPIVYTLLVFTPDFSLNWVALICLIVILANIAFYVWYFKKFKHENTETIGDFLAKILTLTDWTLLSVIPNAFLIMLIGANQLVQLPEFYS